MENYNITVEHKKCDYLEDNENDYRVTISILSNEERVARFIFNISNLKNSEIPNNYEEDWSMHLNIESDGCFYIKNKNEIVTFSTNLGPANTEFRLKYTPIIDEMLNKLKEVYAL